MKNSKTFSERFFTSLIVLTNRFSEERYHQTRQCFYALWLIFLPSTARPTPAPTTKNPKPVSCAAPACAPQTCLPSCPKPCCNKRFNDMELVAGCPRVCYKRCDQRCPRRCCGPHPPLKRIGLMPKINDIPQSPKCPKICADVCALECPHRCCGPGSMKRSFISKVIPRLAYMKNQYAYAQRRNQIPVLRYSNPRRFGLKKRDTKHY